MTELKTIPIPDFSKMPTPREMKERHKYEFKFLINNWSEGLLKHKVPSFCYKFDITEYSQFFLNMADGNVCEQSKKQFLELIKPAFATGRAKFVRLNRRSPKDATIKCFSEEEVFESLSSSMRAFDDIHLLQLSEEKIFLYFAEWDHYLDQKEFRCFVKDRKLIAISQYEGTKIKGFPEDCIKETVKEINDLYEKILPCIEMKDFVFDCFFHPYSEKALFLEINPYGLSDPCFFINYENVEKGGFAYQKTVIEEIQDNPSKA